MTGRVPTPQIAKIRRACQRHVRFWTEEFFTRAAELVNADERFSAVAKGISTSITIECSDGNSAFAIRVAEGQVSVSPAFPNVASEFSFSAPYDEWVGIVRDGLKMQGEVVKGRVKFKGSMPKMLLYLGRVSKLEGDMIARMREIGAEY